MFGYDLHWIEWACGSISTALFAVWIWKHQEDKKPKRIINTDPPLKVPDVIVTIHQYLDGMTSIKATTAHNVPLSETGKHHIIDTVFKNAGYEPHIQQYTIEPPQATLEASTELKGEEVTVGKSKKKEPPKTVDEAVNGMKAKGNTLNELDQPFEPHPKIDS